MIRLLPQSTAVTKGESIPLVLLPRFNILPHERGDRHVVRCR